MWSAVTLTENLIRRNDGPDPYCPCVSRSEASSTLVGHTLVCIIELIYTSAHIYVSIAWTPKKRSMYFDLLALLSREAF